MNPDFAQSLAEVSVVISRELPLQPSDVCVELAYLALEGAISTDIAALKDVPAPDGSEEPYMTAVRLAAQLALTRP